MNEGVYLFLQNETGNIGGGQLYVYRKMQYLKRHGFTPAVCYFLDSRIKIFGMLDFHRSYVREMQIPYCAHISRSRERGIRKIISAICAAAGVGSLGQLAETGIPVAIESYSALTLLWGEAVAARLSDAGVGVKPLLLNILESFPVYNAINQQLIEYKIAHNQCRTIDATVARRRFPKLDMKGMELPGNIAQGINVEDCGCPALEYEDKGCFTMMYLGRLDKPIFKSIVRGVAEFATRHPEEEFDILVIGGASTPRQERKLLKSVLKIPNLRLHATGGIYPVPRQAMKLADLMIGNSGSVVEASRQGLRCAVVDGVDFQGIGLYGETTHSALARTEKERQIRIPDLIESVYADWKSGGKEGVDSLTYKGSGDLSADSIPDIFEPHLEWLEKAENTIWPEIGNIRPQTVKERILNILLRLNGENFIYLLKYSDFASKIRGLWG